MSREREVTPAAVVAVGVGFYRDANRGRAARRLNELADLADDPLASDLRAAALVVEGAPSPSQGRKCIGAVVRRYWPDEARP